VNIFVLIMLIVHYIIMRAKNRDSIDNYSKKLLRLLITMNMFALIIEPLTWITDGLNVWGGFYWSYLSNFFLVLLGTSMAGIWVSYVDYKIFEQKSRLRERFYYMHGLILVAVLLIINAFTPVFFEISKETFGYRSGPFKWVNHLTIYLVYSFSLVLIIRHRKRINSSLIVMVVLFLFIPLFGSIIHTIYSRLFFGWSTIAITITMAYFLLETTSSGRDYLTKLYNRQSFEEYTSQLVDREAKFSVFMIDLDGFKEINDTYGHAIGDVVLIEFSNILMKVFGSFGIVARLGGDEFIIVHEDCNRQHVEKSLGELKSHLKESKIPQLNTLEFSHGYEESYPGMTFDGIYTLVDHKMYRNKLEHRNNK